VASPITRVVALIGWVGLIICIALLIAQYTAQRDYYNVDRGLQERFHSLNEYGDVKVAIINVSGVLIDGNGYVKRQIDRVRSDDNVKAVVLRVDSPGGTVAASDYIYHHLKKLKQDKDIDLVVSMGSMAASGGYYVSMAVGDEEQSIYAEPSTITGSIGVIVPHYDISGLMEDFNVKDDSVASGPHKQMLSMTRSMSDSDREIVQAFVDDAFGQFKDVVKYGRPGFKADDGALDALATGEIFTARQAKDHGLIDEIGFIEDAIERVIELADLDEREVRVIEYKRPITLMEEIVGVKQAGAASLDPGVLLDLTAPRAYYLATWLPAIVRSRRGTIGD
jgi:protease-4